MNKNLFCNKYSSFCSKYNNICNLNEYYYPIIKKVLLISLGIILLVTILLSIGLNDKNYFGWLSEIEYNPQIVNIKL